MPIQFIVPTRNPIAQMFPELLCNDNEDLHMADCIHDLEINHVYSDGRTMAHIQDH